jgi:hypothetical protein
LSAFEGEAAAAYVVKGGALVLAPAFLYDEAG